MLTSRPVNHLMTSVTENEKESESKHEFRKVRECVRKLVHNLPNMCAPHLKSHAHLSRSLILARCPEM